MALAQDAADILSIWGEVQTVRRKSVTYGDTGKPTITYATVSNPTGYIQPSGGELIRTEKGEEIRITNFGFYENGLDVIEGDRIRPNGWSAGNDEFEVKRVEAWAPSHVRCSLILVKGHGG